MYSLAQLPAEILHSIARELRPQFEDPLKPTSVAYDEMGLQLPGHWDEDCGQLLSLSRLSKTCRALRDVAQCNLFHAPLARGQRFVYLVRTLCERPDLASAVKHLHVGVDWGLSDARCIFSESDVAMLSHLVDKHCALEVVEATGPPSPIFINYTRDDYDNTLDEDDDIFHEDDPLTQEDDGILEEDDPSIQGGDSVLYEDHIVLYCFSTLALALACKIERLYIEPVRGLPPSLEPDSLPYLTELFLVHEEDDARFDMDDFYDILKAAPSLRILRCRSATSISTRITHDNLRTLELQRSALDAKGFRTVMQGFPRLESLVYVSAGIVISRSNDATPREVSDALPLRRDTLKHLSISLNHAWYELEELQDIEMMGSLAMMEVLEELNVDGAAIYCDDEDGTDIEPDEDLLTDFLPSTICRLVVQCPHADMAPAMLRLVDESQTRFPCLTDIGLSGYLGKMYTAVEAACTPKGIRYRTDL